MSARYALFRWPAELNAVAGFAADQPAQWNIAPGARVPMLRQQDGERRADLARWGLTPAWLTDLSRTPAQARLETLDQQPMFRNAFHVRRCLLPANGFYEWRGVRKRPYWLTASEPLLYFAAIWEAYPVAELEYLSVALISRAAGNQRRPILLDAAQQAIWLAADTLIDELLALLNGPQPQMRERALAHFINDPLLNGPECLNPA